MRTLQSWVANPWLVFSGLITLTVFSTWSIKAKMQCFDLEQELRYCAHKHRIQLPANPLAGYSFGYGSLNDTEYMCRTKWHILVFHCMRKRSEEMCRNSEAEQFRQLIWSISLETRKFERAAAYICHEHNLRILREHQNKCLKEEEHRAEQCNVHRNGTIREVVAALQNHSSRIATSSEYFNVIRRTLASYECKSLHAKLDCLFDVLRYACPPNAVRLIMNYFKETLPDNCHFNYEHRFADYPQADLKSPLSHVNRVDDKTPVEKHGYATARNSPQDSQPPTKSTADQSRSIKSVRNSHSGDNNVAHIHLRQTILFYYLFIWMVAVVT